MFWSVRFCGQFRWLIDSRSNWVQSIWNISFLRRFKHLISFFLCLSLFSMWMLLLNKCKLILSAWLIWSAYHKGSNCCGMVFILWFSQNLMVQSATIPSNIGCAKFVGNNVFHSVNSTCIQWAEYLHCATFERCVCNLTLINSSI